MASPAVAAASFSFPSRCARSRWAFASAASASASCSTSQPRPADDAAPHRRESPGSRSPRRGEVLEATCEDLAFNGRGVCRAAGSSFVLLCDRALPGERFLARVSRMKTTYAEVKKLKTLEIHNDFVDAPCPYAGRCGGCRMQNLDYFVQLRYKAKQVRELLVTIGKFDADQLDQDGVLRHIVPCKDQFHYRNKMEFSFGAERWMPHYETTSDSKMDNVREPALGLHVPGFFDKVIHIKSCLLQSEAANKVLALIQDFWMEPFLQLSPYNVHKHTGFLKHLMIRKGSDISSGAPELMVNFVTSSYKPKLLEPLVSEITKIPDVVSIVNNVNSSVGNTSVGEEEYVLYGRSTITETLRGLTFQISANSFFQTNTKQADILYKLIEDCAGIKDGSEIVLDLFCGTGTIGLALAKRVRHVYGYEVVAEAVADARRNAELNDITNATFIQGDLNKISETFGMEFPKPDIIISDPNRPGMHTKLIKYLLHVKASRLVYVSCNPSTCARDLDYLCHGLREQGIAGCYELKSIQPVDMFPHTPHIECICALELC